MEMHLLNPRPHTVMIIDDDEAVSELLVAILNEQGMDVFSASSGREGLDFLAKGNVPDLIVTDMMMPEMDGGEFLKRVRSNPETKNIPVIISSALDELETKASLMGATALLKKPYSIEKFAKMIKANLH